MKTTTHIIDKRTYTIKWQYWNKILSKICEKCICLNPTKTSQTLFVPLQFTVNPHCINDHILTPVNVNVFERSQICKILCYKWFSNHDKSICVAAQMKTEYAKFVNELILRYTFYLKHSISRSHLKMKIGISKAFPIVSSSSWITPNC